MTASELADTLGMKPQYLNMIIHGERTGKKYMSEISRILEIEIE
ncbi:MAG: helix-turn-helix transcriptional regulator [Roseburia sp.]|nr:helix-turn-helix transcriptional regulator [Roseburia sp.]